jgi:hypothetical protein
MRSRDSRHGATQLVYQPARPSRYLRSRMKSRLHTLTGPVGGQHWQHGHVAFWRLEVGCPGRRFGSCYEDLRWHRRLMPVGPGRDYRLATSRKGGFQSGRL